MEHDGFDLLNWFPHYLSNKTVNSVWVKHGNTVFPWVHTTKVPKAYHFVEWKVDLSPIIPLHFQNWNIALCFRK